MVIAAYLYVYGYWALLCLLCVIAARWGGAAERTFGFLLLGGSAASLLLKSSITTGYRNLEIGVLVIDMLFLAAVAVMATLTRRGWLIWALAFHLVATTGHLAKLMNPGLSRMAYSLMVGSQSYPLLILLGVAIAQYRRRAIAGSAGVT